MDRFLHFNPRSVEEVFLQFKGRRTALLRALTKDFDQVYEQCDPAMNKLCLYGHPGERWEVNFPGERMHPVLPEPLRGINFARDSMDKRDWLTMLAVHSDIWLLAVAFSFSLKFGHDKAERSRLFNMINELPTIFEVVSGKAKEPPKQKPKIFEVVSAGKAKEPPKQKPKVRNDDIKPKRKYPTRAAPRNGKEEAVVVCGECKEGYIEGEMWKSCYVCESTFHLMKCLNFTKDQHLQLFVCSSCTQNQLTKVQPAGKSTKMGKF